MHLALDSKAGANHTSTHLPLRAQMVCSQVLVIGQPFLSTAKEKGQLKAKQCLSRLLPPV